MPEWKDTAADWWGTVTGWLASQQDAASAWLAAHDLTIELTAAWLLASALTVSALVNLVSWLALRYQVDQTDVGRTLKPKKLSESVKDSGLASLYWLGLWAYYDTHDFGVWEKLFVRALVVGGAVGASIAGVRFVIALWRENREAGE